MKYHQIQTMTPIQMQIIQPIATETPTQTATEPTTVDEGEGAERKTPRSQPIPAQIPQIQMIQHHIMPPFFRMSQITHSHHIHIQIPIIIMISITNIQINQIHQIYPFLVTHTQTHKTHKIPTAQTR